MGAEDGFGCIGSELLEQHAERQAEDEGEELPRLADGIDVRIDLDRIVAFVDEVERRQRASTS